jgi:glyoxylate reductase
MTAANGRPRIVVTRTVPGEVIERLRAVGEVWVNPDDRPLAADELRYAACGCAALLPTGLDRVDEALLEAAGSALRVVANVAVGYDNIDLDAAAGRGVVVTNTPGVLTEATADLAFGLLLAAARRIAEGDRLVRRGEGWTWSPTFKLGADLAGSTLGVVGLGRIGQAVARRARGFDMRVIYSSRRPAAPDVEAMLAAERVPLERLLRTSDFVTLHCPHTADTERLIGRTELARMKPTAILVNTSRGAVVDEAALADALRSGAIAGAGLDVYEREPHVHPGLLESERVVLVPHVGSATAKTRHAMAQLAAGNAIAVLAGQPPLTPIPSARA